MSVQSRSSLLPVLVLQAPSLIEQGLLQGFISHKLGRFAITGTKAKGGDAVAAGFPNPWMALSGKAERVAGASEVPGWKKEGAGPGGRIGGVQTVQISGARPVGAFG